jgi:hypothetical protein
MWVMIKFRISAIGSPPTLHISTEDVNDSVLNFFCNGYKIHVIAAARGTFDLGNRSSEPRMKQCGNKLYLNFIAIVLVEALKALDQQEVCSKP